VQTTYAKVLLQGLETGNYVHWDMANPDSSNKTMIGRLYSHKSVSDQVITTDRWKRGGLVSHSYYILKKNGRLEKSPLLSVHSAICPTLRNQLQEKRNNFHCPAQRHPQEPYQNSSSTIHLWWDTCRWLRCSRVPLVPDWHAHRQNLSSVMSWYTDTWWTTAQKSNTVEVRFISFPKALGANFLANR
jgi:hypothetical protein